MITSTGQHVISAAEAAEYALISYRQLDHWDRKGWVTPSVRAATGRGGRRLYSHDDVLRLAALRHFARSGWPINDVGGQLAGVALADARWLVVGTVPGLIALADAGSLHESLSEEGYFSVYDLEPLRKRLERRSIRESSGAGQDIDLRRPA